MFSAISQFFLPSILVGGATAFGVFGMPIQMGLFIVACGLAIVFLNIDKFESFKGAGFEAKVVRGTEASVLEQHQKILLEVLKSQLKESLLPLTPSADSGERNVPIRLDKPTQERLLALSDSRYISVDLSQFGYRKGEWKFLPEDFQTAPEFLDQVFLLLSTSVSPLSYGKQWMLIDKSTGSPLRGLDKTGPVNLAQAGLVAGATLAVTKV